MRVSCPFLACLSTVTDQCLRRCSSSFGKRGPDHCRPLHVGLTSFRYFSRKSTAMDRYNELNLDDTLIQLTSENAIDFASTHGVVMRNRKQLELMNYAPFTLFPSPFPDYLFQEALDVQQSFHHLTHQIKQDKEFLKQSLKSVISEDEFTGRLYDIYDKVEKEGIKQPKTLFLMRSDYMIHENSSLAHMNGDSKTLLDRKYEIKQIEVNLIASSFAGLGTETCKLHRHVADVLGKKSPFSKDKLPPNDAVRGLGLGLAKGWQAYGNKQAVVLFVVQVGEKNRYDQRLLEYQFYEGVKDLGYKEFVPVMYKTLEEVYTEGKLSSDHKLTLDGREVALAYFRAGYSPNDYPKEECWEGRLLLERSTAIKCPDIGGHLLGCKKIQQVLANPGVVERFVKDEKELHKIRRTFAGLYSLDPGAEGDQAESMALKNPEKFVLKPQREGGGNNFYGKDIVTALSGMTDPRQRGQFILMERVLTPVYKNYVVHIDFGGARLLDVVNELGIYGVLLVEHDKQLVSETVGYLVRTKSIEHDDGGVAAGRAVLDSAYLF